ncbi:M1 aminopeptidase family protein [Hymenobacter jeollabukensis]|uniref:M1 family metallopeptidase n=1 Tax=Hymenobacter jeollabukensis TaxID=2025313 RepID=A0A5R8WH62_9BACT|nr:M1 family metallopeptidase [Hymenobacter jeollabukensis]TLM87401.1 M1 family metallopeptidase [Hymenobacter jeollabukensis]
MLTGLLRFEWRYHTRRATFAVAALLLALISAFLVGTGYGPANVHVNSPYAVAQSLGVLSLLGVFVLTVFCAPAALRDAEQGMTGIVWATPVGRPRYLLSRLGGALLAGTAVLTLAALVLLLAPLVLPMEPGRLGEVRPVAYLWALLVLALPNLLLVGAVLFAVASLTRSTLATYVGAVAIYALYLVTALLIDSPLMAGTAPPTPEGLARAALLDPFGLSAFFEQTRYWTPAERDSRLLALSGHLLLNRLLWLSVAAAVLGLVYARFSPEETPRRRARPLQPAAETVPPTVVYQPVAPAPRSAAAFRRTLGWALRRELGHILRGWPFLTLLALWVFVVAMECSAQSGGGEYGTHLLPTTGLMLDAIRLPLLLLGTVVVVYYAAEVVWRERVLGIAALLDATPAPNAAFFLAKAAALSTLPLLLALAGMAVGAVTQLVQGYAHVDVGLYLTLFWFAGLPLILFALGALALQVISPNRWLGMMAGLLLAFVAYRGSVLGLEHPMWHFGNGPTGDYSEMDGFGPVLPSFAAFMLYWALLAALLAAVSGGLWQRGTDASLSARLRILGAQWAPRTRRWLLAGAGLLTSAAGWLYWQTSVQHPWQSRSQQEAWQADYERQYRPLAARPQPGIVAVRTHVELYPRARRAVIRGRYVLENQTDKPLDTVFVQLPEDLTSARLTLPGAQRLRYDPRFGVELWRLPQPLAPGARTRLHFRLALDRSGIRAGGFSYDVTANGSMLMSAEVFPSLGYRPGRELSDPAARRRQSLRAAPTAPAPLPRTAAELAAVHAAGPGRAWHTLDATIGTDLDQTALGPGQLVRRWTQAGRRYFRYRQRRLTTPNFGLLSAHYAVRRARQGPVTVEVWFHPAHGANAARVLAAATRSLRVLSARYGAYPHPTLRIAEVPAWAPFGAYALPGLVLFTEDRGFTAAPQSADVDLLLRRVAHEVSHQWWGHTLDPADVLGGSTLIETLAKHSEQLVLADAHGPEALPAVLAFDEDRYLAGRTDEAATEPAMLAVDDQAYLYYGKGAVMMSSLRARLGPAAVDRALARLLVTYGGPHGAATTRDLWTALLTEAPTATDRAAVDEWLTRQVVRELRVDTALVQPAADGRFQAEIRISARKTAGQGRREIAQSTDGETVEVTVLDGPPGSGRLLYHGEERVVGSQIQLKLRLPKRPAYVVVDPAVRYLDRDRTNNQRRFVAGP